MCKIVTRFFLLNAIVVIAISACKTSGRIESGLPIHAPSSFTPNGDGKNDTWQIENLGQYGNIEVIVYNRLGSIVYQSKGVYNPWDGNYKSRKVSAGIYYYVIDTGKRSSNINGWLTITR